MELAEVTQKCPNCEAAIRPNAMFCHKCGFSYQALSQNQEKTAMEVEPTEVAPEWFAPSLETRELSEESLGFSESFSAQIVDDESSANNLNQNVTPSAMLMREHKEWLARENEEKQQRALKKLEDNQIDETTEIKMETEEIKRRIAELDQQSAPENSQSIPEKLKEEPTENLIAEEQTQEPPEIPKKTVDLRDETGDIPSFRLKDKEPEEKMPEKTEMIAEETDFPNPPADAPLEKTAAASPKINQPKPVPRRQFSKTKEYVWEESGSGAGGLFLLVALLAVVIFGTIFWFSGFFKF